MTLRFTYGCMGSGKSALLVMKEFNHRSRGYETIVMKPIKDARDPGIIKPRPMEGLDVDVLYRPEDNLYNIVKSVATRFPRDRFAVFVDEIQFSTKEQIEQLWRVSANICDVYVYGLKINYLNTLFEPIPDLIIYADVEDELEVGCKYCNDKARTHLLYIDDELILEGNEDVIGDLKGSKRFESVCQKCRRNQIDKYFKNKL